MNFTNETLILSITILGGVVCILIGLVLYLHFKLKKFLIGSSSTNLDESITTLNTSVRELETFRKELEVYLTTVEKRLKKSVQSVHTVRFNPFKGTGSGGNQSFATAFINEDGDGVVISSIYSREHMSVFSKPVKKTQSEYDLSGEEKEALQIAFKSLKE